MKGIASRVGQRRTHRQLGQEARARLCVGVVEAAVFKNGIALSASNRELCLLIQCREGHQTGNRHQPHATSGQRSVGPIKQGAQVCGDVPCLDRSNQGFQIDIALGDNTARNGVKVFSEIGDRLTVLYGHCARCRHSTGKTHLSCRANIQRGVCTRGDDLRIGNEACAHSHSGATVHVEELPGINDDFRVISACCNQRTLSQGDTRR